MTVGVGWLVWELVSALLVGTAVGTRSEHHSGYNWQRWA